MIIMKIVLYYSTLKCLININCGYEYCNCALMQVSVISLCDE